MSNFGFWIAVICSFSSYLDPSFPVTTCMVSVSSIISLNKSKLWLLVYHTLLLLVDKSLLFEIIKNTYIRTTSSVSPCKSQLSSKFTKCLSGNRALCYHYNIFKCFMLSILYDCQFLYFFPKLKLKTLVCFFISPLTTEKCSDSKVRARAFIQYKTMAFRSLSLRSSEQGAIISGKLIFKCSYPEGTYLWRERL